MWVECAQGDPRLVNPPILPQRFCQKDCLVDQALFRDQLWDVAKSVVGRGQKNAKRRV
jgi:hypothetical protein